MSRKNRHDWYKSMECCCADCEHFVPDDIGFGDGIGDCQLIIDFKKKNPDRKALEIAYKRAGDKLMWPKAIRRCTRFKKKRLTKVGKKDRL
jgi:hypothetical protein